MAQTPPPPALEVSVNVRWPGGDRVFHMAITHEAILARAAGDALLATLLQERIKVSFAHWRRLEVQLAHVWTSGQGQVIYSHTTTENNRSTQEQVMELLAWWQQLACLEPRSVRMHLVLDIDPAGVPELPPRPRLVSVTPPLFSATPPPTQLPPPDAQPSRSRLVSAPEPHYQQAEGVASDEDPRIGTYITFDRANGMWSKISFTRAASLTRPCSIGETHD
jgi:hypothetical protein